MAINFTSGSGSNLYGDSVSQTRGEIDLRDELSRILRGDFKMPQRGHWVILRRFDLSQRSDKYDEVYGEGIGGPGYEYTDTLYLTRRDVNRVSDSGEMDAAPGNMKGGEFTYYFEHNVSIKKEDQIFEIEWADMRVRPLFSQIPTPYKEKYNIKDVHHHRLDSGRIEYIEVYAITDQVNY